MAKIGIHVLGGRAKAKDTHFMGMTCELYALRPADCDRVVSDRKWAARLFAGQHKPARLLRLEKSWHGLHVLLTGSEWGGDPPLNFLLRGGKQVYEEKNEDSPRVFRPVEVQALDSALSSISDEAFWGRFDRGRMQKLQVYPGQAWDEPEAGLRSEFVGRFRELKAFVHDASATGMGILVSVGDGEQEYGTAMEGLYLGPLGPTVRRWSLIFFGSVMGFMTLVVLSACVWRYRRMGGRRTDSDPRE